MASVRALKDRLFVAAVMAAASTHKRRCVIAELRDLAVAATPVKPISVEYVVGTMITAAATRVSMALVDVAIIHVDPARGVTKTAAVGVEMAISIALGAISALLLLMVPVSVSHLPDR